jgi:invasion protein IalB
MNKKNMKWYLASAVGAAAVAAGVVVTDQVMGWDFFNLLGSNQSQAQTAPAARRAPPAAAAQPQQPAAPAAPPSAPQRVETINYDAWTVTCRDTVEKSSKKICTGIMQVIEQQPQQPQRVLLAWIIGRDNQGVLRTVIQIPTGVQIPKGVELQLGKSPLRTLPFTACEPQRCEASMAMDDAMVNDAIASPEAKATIYATDGRGINFNMPIKGIDKVFAAIGK